MRELSRRQYLLAVTGGVAGLSGCPGGESGGDDTETPVGAGSGTDRTTARTTDTPAPTETTGRPATESPTATPETESPTETPTPTEQPTPTETPVAAQGQVWSVALDAAATVRPAVADGAAYAGTGGGTVSRHAIEDGTTAWRYDAAGPVQDVRAADDTVLTVAGAEESGVTQTLVAVEAASGRERWRFEPTDAWLTVLAVADGTVYLGTADGSDDPTGQTLYAVSLSDGSTEWSAPSGDPEEAVVTDQGLVAATSGRLYAYDSGGSVRWEQAVPGGVETTLHATGDTLVYAYDHPDVSGDGNPVGFDLASGERQWRFEEWGDVYTVEVQDGMVYVGGASLAALDPADGSLTWRDGPRTFLPEGSVTDEQVYATAAEQSLRAIGRETGDVRWQWESEPSQLLTLPTDVSGGRVFVDGVQDETLTRQYKFGVDAASGEQLWTFEDGTELTRLAVSGRGLAVTGGENGRLYGLA